MASVEKDFEQFFKDTDTLQEIYEHYKGESPALPIEKRQSLIKRFKLEDFCSDLDIVKHIFKDMFVFKQNLKRFVDFMFNSKYNVLSSYIDIEEDKEFLKSIEEED